MISYTFADKRPKKICKRKFANDFIYLCTCYVVYIYISIYNYSIIKNKKKFLYRQFQERLK